VGQLNLAHGNKNEENKEKELKEKPNSSEETVRVIVREGRPVHMQSLPAASVLIL